MNHESQFFADCITALAIVWFAAAAGTVTYYVVKRVKR